MSGPDWTCSACGASGPFRAIRYDTPGEPVEHDMECETCGSLDVRESAAEAAHVLGDRLDEATARAERAEARVKELEAAARDTLRVLAPDLLALNGGKANE